MDNPFEIAVFVLIFQRLSCHFFYNMAYGITFCMSGILYTFIRKMYIGDNISGIPYVVSSESLVNSDIAVFAYNKKNSGIRNV